MNNELIGRIDRMLCCYPTKTINKVLQDCKAALTQQEAEPVGHVRYITAGGNAGLSWVVDQSGPTCGGPTPRNGQPLYLHHLHPPKPAAQPQVLEVGIRGKAFDAPKTCRAYTYSDQPDNLGAHRLGCVYVEANQVFCADHIDAGLALLKLLQERGFGAFELAAAKEEL